jgi:hypothetical protein
MLLSSLLLRKWILAVSTLITVAGLGFVVLDPYLYPVDPLVVPRLVQGVLGATLVGWGMTILLVARYAFNERKPELLRILLYGLLAWAPVDMVVSIFYGAWFNVALNLIIVVAAGIPLILAERLLKRGSSNL